METLHRVVVRLERGDGVPLREQDACWRCDARQATYDVGLCYPCHADLADRSET